MNVRAASMYQASHVEQFAPVPHSVTEAKSASSLTLTCVSLPRYVRSAPPQPDSCTAANSIGIRSPSPRRGIRHSPNGRYGISCPVRGSVRLDARELDHLRPLLGFVGDQLSKVGGRARQRRTTHVGKARLHLGIGKGCVDLVVELVNDLGGGALGRADAVPSTDLVALDKLAYGRKVRQCLRAHRAGYRKSAQLAGFDVLDRRRKRGEQDIRLPTEQGYKCGSITAIRHMDQVDASHRLK